ncbi:Sensory rhodopsin II transducer [uncultured archaeon]|nr:Sensory rhodopsin II transducer [uncultured archaeon]
MHHHGISLGRKLVCGFGFVILLLIIVAALSLTKLGSMEEVTKSLFDNDVALEKKADDINIKLLQARRDEKNFLMRSDLQYVDKVKSSVDGIKNDVAEIQKLDVEQKNKDDANNILVLITGYENNFLELVSLQKQIGLTEMEGLNGDLINLARDAEAGIKKNNNTDALASLLEARRHEKNFVIRKDVAYQAKVRDAIQSAKKSVTASRASADDKKQTISKLDQYLAAFDKFVSLSLEEGKKEEGIVNQASQIDTLVAGIVQDSQVHRANGMDAMAQSNSASRMAVLALAVVAILTGAGTSIYIYRSITRSVNSMLHASGKVASVAQELSNSNEEMKNSTGQISGTTQDIAAGVSQQAQKMAEITRTMKEMSESVQQVAANSQKAAEGAEVAEKTAQEVGGMSGEVLSKMTEIQLTVDGSAVLIKELESKSHTIGEITDVITNIANQTNMLALNAAIEAARAGEHGRGFSVVADEVRKLAEESREAANRITGLIKEVQNGTKNAVESMDKGTKKVSEGAGTIQNTAAAVDRIVKATGNVATMIQEIAATAEEQSVSIEEISASVEDVSTISEESAAATQEASAAVEEQAASMENLVKAAQELAGLSLDLQAEVARLNHGTVQENIA